MLFEFDNCLLEIFSVTELWIDSLWFNSKLGDDWLEMSKLSSVSFVSVYESDYVLYTLVKDDELGNLLEKSSSI